MPTVLQCPRLFSFLLILSMFTCRLLCNRELFSKEASTYSGPFYESEEGYVDCRRFSRKPDSRNSKRHKTIFFNTN